MPAFKPAARAARIAAILSCLLPLTLYSAVVTEEGSLLEFFSGEGVYQGAYDNWISHTVEADQVGWPLNFAPPNSTARPTASGRFASSTTSPARSKSSPT
ncbi:MAG: hypothetical protein FJY67_00950 [Calditrichaeota bacterium]|nr:hypothetical protein [Calditrichota bacterium]